MHLHTFSDIHLHQVAAALTIGCLIVTGLAMTVFLAVTSRDSRVWAATSGALAGLGMVLAYAAYVKLIK